MLARRPTRRPAAATVEMAVVLPILFLLLFGLILGSIGVFRYHQVAQLAREGSRYAAVRGATYARENNKPAATASDVYEQAIRPRATNMDPAKLTYSVVWDKDNRQYHTVIVNDEVKPVTNNVSVTVEYKWDAFLFGPVTLRSTSVSSMHY